MRRYCRFANAQDRHSAARYPEHNCSIPTLLTRPCSRTRLIGVPGRELSGDHRDFAWRAGYPVGAIAPATACWKPERLVMGADACMSFKPGLIDADANVADERTRRFLQTFIDQPTLFVSRTGCGCDASACGAISPGSAARD